MPKPHRLLELDALRGLAALGVCLFHFSMISHNVILPIKIFKYGCTGVDLFFMISGFVIFMSLDSLEDLKEFWFLRFNRLFPAYWLSIIVAVITFLCIPNFEIPKKLNFILGNLFMIQPVAKSGYLVDAYWTLYVELCFYLFISLIWFLKCLNKIELIILFGLTGVLIINGLYLLFETSASYERFFIISRNLMPLISYFGFFASGIIYYKIHTQGWNIYRLSLLVFSFFLTILIHNISGRFNLFFGTFERVLCVAAFNILFILIVNKKARFLKIRWLLFLGGISYALYLIHESLGINVSIYLFNSINISSALICGFITSIGVATLITYFFERPIQKWLKRKYFAQ